MDESERERNPRPHIAAFVHEQVVGADIHDAERDRRLDQARRRGHEIERRQRQRDAVRHGESGDDQQQLPQRSAEQKQSDQKQQVVRADQDVVNSGRHELPDDGGHALPRAGKVLECRVIAIENRLRPQIAAFVHIEECLVAGIVGEHQRAHGDHADPAGAARETELQRQPLREDLNPIRWLAAGPTSIDLDLETGLEE